MVLYCFCFWVEQKAKIQIIDICHKKSIINYVFLYNHFAFCRVCDAFAQGACSSEGHCVCLRCAPALTSRPSWAENTSAECLAYRCCGFEEK